MADVGTDEGQDSSGLGCSGTSPSARYLVAGAAVLLLAGLFGCLAALHHAFDWPHDVGAWFTMQRLQPIHVTFAIAWIYVTYMGILFHGLPNEAGRPLRFPGLARLQFWLMAAIGLGILVTYALGIFSGREYLTFHPAFLPALLLAWAFFLANYFGTVKHRRERWPVYLWMWTTGVILFPVTLLEGHLYLFPFFGNNIIRDLTVQWKSAGALIGSWNMVVYGIAFWLMVQIRGMETAGFRRLAFFAYWLGLTNAFFNFGHHTYVLPQAVPIKVVSFLISMTEVLLLTKAIRDFRNDMRGVREIQEGPLRMTYLFLVASAFWVCVNLTLAIAISIPNINYFTHGTFITVAHSMGSTIGINTMILLAGGFYVLHKRGASLEGRRFRLVRLGFWLTNAALGVLWSVLMIAGILEGNAVAEKGQPLQWVEKHELLSPWMLPFLIAGLLLYVGLIHVLVPWLRLSFASRRRRVPS